MLGNVSMLREFYGYFWDLGPGMVGFEDCESLFTHLKKKKVVSEKFLVRDFLAIQQAIEVKELDNVVWLPGLGNAADGLAKIKSDLVPLLRPLESGSYNPGTSRPQRGVAFREKCEP